MEPVKVEIYEVNYSVSPGGEDCWEMTMDLGNYQPHFGEFKTATEALEYAMDLLPVRELSVSIKSLNWYHANEERE